MNGAYICKSVQKTLRRYGEADPVRLAARMGIKLIPAHMGKEEGCIKGFFLECRRIRTITLNVDLPAEVRRIIVAHELGHAVLHRDHGVHAFRELSLLDGTAVMEREANLFAAELLLKDEDVLKVWKDGDTFFAAASTLNVPSELLAYKLRLMREKGVQIPDAPILAKSDFLKKMELPETTVW